MIEAELRVLARLFGIEEVDTTWSEVYVAVLDMHKLVNDLSADLERAQDNIVELKAKLVPDEASS